jgi:serine/threonine protein kinase
MLYLSISYSGVGYKMSNEDDDDTDSVINKRFGKYLLLDHLVNGGMARICRARFLGEQADKIVAIKMVQSKYSSNKAFQSMFMDEIKVTFGLQHPNIAQTYDYGCDEGQLYTAMEYVDGKNLKQFLDKLRDRKFVFPVEISVHIISQVCQGLHYAHMHTDKLSGKKANIIHRDISPHNIMITYDGAVKIIDFGIAKAESNSDATQAGTIKGKLSYLAPEYLEGIELDPRYDQFAIGITLWELLCSRKLFKASNDLAVLKKIQECKVPAPSSINPNIPQELDHIVLKALSKDRNLRYDNLDQLNRALVKFLYSHYSDFNATDLAYFANELFKDEIQSDRKKMYEYGKIDISAFIADLKKNGEASTSNASDIETTKGGQHRVDGDVIDYSFDEEFGTSKGMKLKKNSVMELKRTQQISKDKGNESENENKVPRSSSLRGTGSKKKSIADKSYNSSSSQSFKNVYIAGFVILALLGGMKFSGIIKGMIAGKKNPLAINEPDQEIPGTTKATTEYPTSDRSKTIIRFVNLDRIKSKIFINGEIVKTNTFDEIVLNSGQYIIRIQEKGKKHFVKTFKVPSDMKSMKFIVPVMPDQGYGYLTTSRNCVEGILHINILGEDRKIQLPIRERLEIPVDSTGRSPASYSVTFEVKGESVPPRRAEFKIEKEYDTIDFCDNDAILKL